MSNYEILGLGCVAVDTIIHVEQFPAEDSKVQVAEQFSLVGGTTATSLLAAAALGARCAFVGVLGDDPASRLVLESFRQAGIDASLVRCNSAARTIRCTVIVSRNSGARTVLYDLAGAVPAGPGWPSEEAIRAAKLLLVDQFGLEGIVPAARIARGAGIPVVAKLEHGADRNDYVPLLEIADHVVLPIQSALQISLHASPAAAVDQLWCDSHRALIVTCGQEGLWYRTSDSQTVRHLPAFAVPARDTTGCGDTFRGAYAARLVRGLSIEEALIQGSAAAAIRASATTPAERLPSLDAVQQFIAARAPMS
jgi:sulfofructose kinase